jgi:hypothetical protein
VGTHRETPLNIDLNIKNERQDRKIGTVRGNGGMGRVNGGDGGEGIWWMGFIYLYEIEQRNLLQLL